jgi:hypothetical protein
MTVDSRQPTASHTIVVLHALGDTGDLGLWEPELRAAGWSGAVVAPLLPGHGGAAPAPVGGNYEVADPAFFGASLPEMANDPPPLVVGIGSSGWSAHLLAIGGRAGGLVLVDGLGSPWLDPAHASEGARKQLRAVADDPEALAPPPTNAPDPRLRYAPRPHGSRSLAFRMARSTSVPSLVIETSVSSTPPDDRREVLDAWAGPVDLVEIESAASLGSLAAAIVGWAAQIGVARIEA